MASRGYEVKIAEASKELTAREKIAIKDTTDCVKLDTATEQGTVIITPDYYAVLDVHNEKSEDKDYKNYIVVDKDGTKYVTGSESFWESFSDIFSDMEGEDEEYSVKAYRVESKNYKGKTFIACSIV